MTVRAGNGGDLHGCRHPLSLLLRILGRTARLSPDLPLAGEALRGLEGAVDARAIALREADPVALAALAAYVSSEPPKSATVIHAVAARALQAGDLDLCAGVWELLPGPGDRLPTLFVLLDRRQAAGARAFLGWQAKLCATAWRIVVPRVLRSPLGVEERVRLADAIPPGRGWWLSRPARRMRAEIPREPGTDDPAVQRDLRICRGRRAGPAPGRRRVRAAVAIVLLGMAAAVLLLLL